MASQLLQHAIQIIKQYNVKLTVRQIYYRLVAANIIKNSRSSYNYLDRVLTKGRLSGEVSWNSIEDRSRSFLAGDVEKYQTPEEFMKWRIEALKESASRYEMPFWLNQPEHVEVWVEKDALASLISRACNQYKVRLAPSKGYGSVSFIHEASEALRQIDKPITILYFGDFDMRGVDIQRYLKERLQEDFGVNVIVQRIALTRKQVEKYELPPQPAKKTDTMARGWIESQGDVAWELDALEPNILLNLVRDAITEHLDQDVFVKRNALFKQNVDRINDLVEKLFNGLEKQNG